jgi:hypothetical protein
LQPCYLELFAKVVLHTPLWSVRALHYAKHMLKIIGKVTFLLFGYNNLWQIRLQNVVFVSVRSKQLLRQTINTNMCAMPAVVCNIKDGVVSCLQVTDA